MKKFIRQIPNILTLANLGLGCAAVSFILNNDLAMAALMIYIAAFLDFTDGAMARWLHAESETGKQLDTLADIVSFGLVPGLVFFKLISMALSTGSNSFSVLSSWNLLGFLVTIAAAWRLARFNLSESESKSFRGLATPASALLTVSLPLVLMSDEWGMRDIILNKYFLAGAVLLLSYLMVSSYRMFSLKFDGSSWQHNKVRYLFVLGAIGLTLISIFLINIYVIVPCVVIFYIILSLINSLFRKTDT
ncbi:MAG: CDP-alcohol phosphatidyltransferase family protein [Bacteroidetes bacterium]|nr:CDP-alcohol phosphatidyltransferase family protein [Bacteroidota bacterium]